MFLLGHAGITLGAAALTAGIGGKNGRPPVSIVRWLLSLSRHLDIRFLLVGSVLPDIIDKPVGTLIFRETFHNGRIFSHTLLFVAVLAVAGFFIYRRRKRTWMIALAAGSAVHLVLDQMWATPSTLFWPAYGIVFIRARVEGLWASYLNRLVTDPSVYIPEIIGLVILIWFVATVVSRRSMGVFLKYGVLS